MRADYHEVLDTTRRDLTQLGALTKDALHFALQAFKKRDTAMAGRIIADDQMDLLRRRIETTCVELLWRQQPVASELREVTAIHEIAIDLGIVMGQVNEIAKQAIRVAATEACPDTSDVDKVATMTEAMLGDAMHSFEKRDEELVASVYALADEVEDSYTPALEAIQGQMQANSSAVTCGISLLFEMTALQRIAERAENIAWHTEEML